MVRSAGLLTSWKEIARHFGRSVRTVQQWEKHEGLPVRRHLHKRQSSVYADPAELDAWWRQHASTLTVVPSAPDPPAPAAEAASTSRPMARSMRRQWAAGIAALLMVAVVVPIASRVVRHPMPTSPRFPIKTLENLKAGSYLMGGFAGDINGDGNDDAILSAYTSGETYVVFGGTIRDRDALPAAAGVVIRQGSGDWLLATDLADFNGDGIKDLLLTSPVIEPSSYRRSGASYIMFGRLQWPRALTLPADADVTLRIERAPDAGMGGCRTGGPADLNGDGIADVFLGAAEYGDGDLKSAGALFVLFGRREWPPDVDVAGSADVTFRGSRMGEGLSTPCVTGDFDGDHVVDVAVYANENRLWNLLGGRGRLYGFAGRAHWPKRVDAARDFAFRIDGVRPGASMGGLVAGDFDGDGVDDLAASMSRLAEDHRDVGQVRLWLHRDRARISPIDSADVIIDGAMPVGRLGEKLSTADVDGDGVADLIIAEPARGTLHLLYGRRRFPSRATVAAAAIPLAVGAPGQGSWDVAHGDLDGDRLPDLVVSSEELETAVGPRTGRAWILKPYVDVRLDVRPEFEPNVVILPGGLLVARIYGWSTTDRFDPATFRLAGARPVRIVRQDFNGDGFEDLQVYLHTAGLQLSRDSTRLTFTARTVGGLPVAGSDSIVVVSADRATNSVVPQSILR